jgi:glycosyltransferase involved in cell wall biosynthesis
LEKDCQRYAGDLRGAGMSSPVVSVVMSVCNEEKYLNDTINSILNQTLADFEFIIVNDGSEDKTQSILNKYKKLDCRIKLISNQKNLGIAKSTNIGIKNADGKYIAIMDAGDISHRQRLEKQTKYLEARDEVYILGTQGRWIDGEGKAIGIWKMPRSVDGKALYKTGGAIHPSIMARRALFDVIGLYDETLIMSQEFDLYMRSLKNGLKMANLEDELICIRERREGMTFKHMKTLKKNQLKIKIKYLPAFFGFWNIIYTLRSFLGFIIPTFMLMMIVKHMKRL